MVWAGDTRPPTAPAPLPKAAIYAGPRGVICVTPAQTVGPIGVAYYGIMFHNETRDETGVTNGCGVDVGVECAGELRANGREPEAGAGVHLGVVRQRGERRACGRRSGGALIVFKNSSSHRFRCAPAFLGFARLFISSMIALYSGSPLLVL